MTTYGLSMLRQYAKQDKSEKERYHMILLICGLKKNHRYKELTGDCQNWEMGSEAVQKM